MRLGQLSRKISISSSEILDYIESELGVHIDASLNSKIEDQYLNQIIDHFTIIDTPDIKIEVPQNPDPEEEVKDIDEAVINEAKEIEPEDVEALTTEENLIPNLKTETIKAKAHKLEGLKVIGKIDLPPPPPPEMIEIDGVMYDKAEVKKQKKEEKEQRRLAALKRKEVRESASKIEEVAPKPIVKKVVRRRLVSDAELRAREEKEVEKKKIVTGKRLKEKQKNHYAEKHMVTTFPSAKKKVPRKEKEIIPEIIANDVKVPKTLLGKFWRWLNTY